VDHQRILEIKALLTVTTDVRWALGGGRRWKEVISCKKLKGNLRTNVLNKCSEQT
jgi:hypothetical protein